MFSIVASDMEKDEDEYLAFWSIVARSRVTSPHGVSRETLIEYIPLLNDMYGCNIEESHLTHSMDGVLRGENLGKLLIYVMATFVSRMDVFVCSVVIEDAQWMDSSSWKLLLEVSRHIENVSIFISCRYPIDSPPAEFSKLMVHPRTRKIDLKPLDEESSCKFVKKKLGVTAGRLPEEICLVLRDKGVGNPFYMEEMAFSMLDRGYIAIENGKCFMTANQSSFRDIKWPSSVEEVVAQRIEQLPQDCQLVIKVASVIGRTFYIQLLSEVYPIPQMRKKLLPLLRKCQTVDLVPKSSGEFVFKHIAIREVAYNMLLHKQRKAIHQSIGEYYEKHSPEIENFYSRLSYHFLEAEDYEKGKKYLELSGVQALKTFSNLEAVNCFEKILKLREEKKIETKSGNLASIYGHLGDAYKNLGQVNQSRTYFRLCLMKSGFPEPSTNIGKGIGIIGEVLKQLLHRITPQRYIGSKRHFQDQYEFTELVVRSSASLQEYSYFEGDIPGTLYFALSALNMSEKISPFSMLPSMYLSTAALCIVAKMPRGWGEFYFAQGISEAYPIELRDQPWVYVLAGLYNLMKGDIFEAMKFGGKGIEVAKKLGDNRHIDMLSALMWEASSVKGEMRLATKFCESTDVSYSNNIDRQSSVWKNNWRFYGYLKYGYGDFEKLSAAVQSTRDASEHLPFLEKLCTACICGSLALSIPEISQALTKSNKLDPSAFTIIFPYEIALVSLLRCFDDLDSTTQRSNRSVVASKRNSIWNIYLSSVRYMKKVASVFPLGWSYYWRHKMHIHIRVSDYTSAKKALVLCHESAVKHGQKYAGALALYERASLWEDEVLYEEPENQNNLISGTLKSRSESQVAYIQILHDLGISPTTIHSHRIPY
eukprot:TRINITY_DN237_c3_g1_i1.p1 TRINITY_DN237_c3_g1~~TRINITY_DN237_c3_g1_i1.p1  ORF type:complete len:876 (+),score=99.55 TRINITY_DN237_c3_g1_i1:2661-5288(+)